MCDAFLEWGQNDFKQSLTPKCENSLITEDDFVGIRIDKDGHITTYDENFFPINVGLVDFFASGSGQDLARGAMAYGATAKQAVEIACKYDLFSGGKIGTITFKTDKPKKKTPAKKKKVVAKT